jgi:hypothetical protein
MKSKILLSVFLILSTCQVFGYDNTEDTKELSEILMKARSTPQGQKFVIEDEDNQDEGKPKLSLKSKSVRVYQKNKNSSDETVEATVTEPQY